MHTYMTHIHTYITLYYTTRHYITLHYITVQYITYTTLDYTTLHYTTLHDTTLHYTTLHCTTLHYTTLHCITFTLHTLHYTTLHYTVHCITYRQTDIHTHMGSFQHIGRQHMAGLCFGFFSKPDSKLLSSETPGFKLQRPGFQHSEQTLCRTSD